MRNALVFTVSQSSQVMYGAFALLTRGRRLPQVVQKRRPLKAILPSALMQLGGRALLFKRQSGSCCAASHSAQTTLHVEKYITVTPHFEG